jgi:hypothetical protein
MTCCRNALFSFLLIALPALAIEEPSYQVVRKTDAIEIRTYAAYMVAETRVDSEFAEAGNVAFSALFKYISGNNRRREKIEMTAPVNQSAVADRGQKIEMTAPVAQSRDQDGRNGYVVSFAMPARFGPANIPQPEDPRVTVREVPARTMAVLAYSGTWSEERYAAHEQKLMEEVASAGLKPRGTIQFARYNAPFVPWFLRRNEVMVEIDPQAGGGIAPG